MANKYKNRGERQIAALSIAIDLGIPVYMLGAPATTKTKVLQAMAAAKGRPLRVQLLQHKDPTDFGWQVPSGDRMKVLAPEWLFDAAEAPLDCPYIIFFDEVNWASPRVQAIPT